MIRNRGYGNGHPDGSSAPPCTPARNAAPDDEDWPVEVARIGRFHSGAGLMLEDRMGHVPLPGKLGWEH